MNYKALKWMIESVVNSYKCPECTSEVDENNVDVIWAAGSTINIDITCPSCWKHSMIKSEVMSVDLSNMNITPEKLEQLKQGLGNLKWNVKASIVWWNTLNTIKDEEIVDLNEDLRKSALSVDDLLSDSDK